MFRIIFVPAVLWSGGVFLACRIDPAAQSRMYPIFNPCFLDVLLLRTMVGGDKGHTHRIPRKAKIDPHMSGMGPWGSQVS